MSAQAEQLPRDSYAEAGTAAREAIERAVGWAAANPHQKRLTRDARVLLAVMHFTALYSRVWDRVYVAQIAAVAGLDEHRTQKALAFWAACGVIEWRGSQGRGRQSWVSLRVSSAEKTRPLVNLLPTDLTEKPGEFCRENPASSDPPTENLSEKSSEQKRPSQDFQDFNLNNNNPDEPNHWEMLRTLGEAGWSMTITADGEDGIVVAGQRQGRPARGRGTTIAEAAREFAEVVERAA